MDGTFVIWFTFLRKVYVAARLNASAGMCGHGVAICMIEATIQVKLHLATAVYAGVI